MRWEGKGHTTRREARGGTGTRQARQLDRGGTILIRRGGRRTREVCPRANESPTAVGHSRWAQPLGPPGVEKSSYGRLGDLPLVFFLLKRLPTQLAPLATQLKPLRPKLMAPVTARPMLLNTPPLLLLPLRPLSLLLLLLLLLLPVTHGGGGGARRG